MKQKTVKITGLTLNQSLGIIEAREMVFDKDNKLIVFKGAVGEGKTTLQKGLQVVTQGQKTFVDNKLYGEIDAEVQLLDGELPLWVGCKSKGKSLQFVLYAKDDNGKKIKNPVIDGIEATPASYLNALQTELTWKMSELTSENPKVQKNILLKLYQSQLKKIGVIFDKNHPDYGTSILGKIDKAVSNRDEKDYLRKTKGGIADDLRANGHDPDRPETCPDSILTENIEKEIKALEKERTTLLAAPEEKKKAELAEIKAKAGEVTNRCLTYNSELKDGYENEIEKRKEYVDEHNIDAELITTISESITKLNDRERLDDQTCRNIDDLIKNQFNPLKEVIEPTNPNYIQFDENNQVKKVKNPTGLHIDGCALIDEMEQLRQQYANILNQDSDINTTKFDEKIATQEKNKLDAIEINKIVDAIDSFHQWRKTDVEVARLKLEYVKLLSKVDTGVEGLKIEPIEDDIFLMYDGSYDVDYFKNKDKEMRKLSSYSRTQKPVICLLIQNYLLSKKDKAMRYLYLDDIPIDRKTRELLERMTKELNLHIFLTITGDFEKNKLQAGEILIHGGEIFFNK